MRYKELKEKVDTWSKTYGLKTIVEINEISTRLRMFIDDEYETIVIISNFYSCVLDTDYYHHYDLPDDARVELFKIIVEFASTKPNDREDEKRFIVPLPGLVTTDGRQQYLTHKDCNFFASRRKEKLRQVWKEEHLKHVPEVYRQFAVEFDENKEY